MSSQPTITFAELKLPDSGTLILFAAAEKKTAKLLQEIDKKTGGQVERAMKQQGFKGGAKETLDLLAPTGLDIGRIVILGLGDMEKAGQPEFMALGGRINACLKADKSDQVTVLAENIKGAVEFTAEASAQLVAGYGLRGYKFNKYKSTDKSDDDASAQDAKTPTELTIGAKDHKAAKRLHDELSEVSAGIELARNLVNEPANILGPVEFAMKARELEELGVKVTILDEIEMAEKGMNALLAVGQGSERGSRLAVMHWNGSDNKREKPVAIIGKGVTFDTGGISIKPSQGMEDMKGDMGGAACVIGLMRALAGREAKANVIGVIGLVENMPDGKAQRPGDVVTSMSGQTIEVINTDAEGRLVLADALWYAKETYKPKLMIDLATLTGAILVALGKEYAGLFSNNEALVKKLEKAGMATDEKVWRLPLGKPYDKMINSNIADMKNIGGRFAGSITAAQFLQRYVDDVPWAHIDVAGTAMSSSKSDINESWGSGYGVRLLNEFIAKNYE